MKLIDNKDIILINELKSVLASKSILKEGHSRHTRDQWVIVIIIGLLLYTAILNRVMSKDFESDDTFQKP